MRKQVFAIIFTGLALGLSLAACCSSTTPSAPIVNDFKITDFQFNVSIGDVTGYVIGTYSNSTNKAVVASGTIDWGDGKMSNVTSGSLTQNASGDWSFAVGHQYAMTDVYTVTINASAPFSNGTISASFSKKIVVNQ